MNTELGLSSAIIIFIIGCYGLISKRDGLKLIISIELMIIGVNLAFISIGQYVDNKALSQTYVVLLLSIGGPLIGFGILLIVLIQARFGHNDIANLNLLRW